MISRRMRLLLKGSSTRVFRSQPKGVGLKTIFQALELGVIEVKGDLRIDRVKCKLTAKGQAVAKSLSTDTST